MFLLLAGLQTAQAATPADVQAAIEIIGRKGEDAEPVDVPLPGGGATRLSGKGLIIMRCDTYQYVIATHMSNVDRTLGALGFTVHSATGEATVSDNDFDGLVDGHVVTKGKMAGFQAAFDAGIACTLAQK